MSNMMCAYSLSPGPLNKTWISLPEEELIKVREYVKGGVLFKATDEAM